MSTGATIPDVSNRLFTTQQSCAWPTLHYKSPPEAPSGERFYCRCSRSSAAKTPRDTAFKPASEWFCCVEFVKIILPRRCSRNTRFRVLDLYYNGPSALLRSTRLCHSLENPSPPAFTFILSLERAPIRAGCIGNFVLRTLICLALRFI